MMKDTIKELIKYSQLIAAQDLVLGSSGNISLKSGKDMLIKASGLCMSEAQSADFLKVALKNLAYKSKKLKPSCEAKMHAICYAMRPDINCVIHTHPLYATTLVSCAIKPRLISPEFILSIGSELKIVEYVCPGTEKLAEKVGQAVKNSDIVYLKNHGLLAVGKTLKEAYTRTLLAEQMAKMQIIAQLLGKNLKGLSAVQSKKLLAHLQGK
ncbi:MAG: class II aldolase/adducin family protein [Candidatus Omnitrophica bacterium]|nr:class II aldolase/adducin family protein [Candidatus Omnitrophota bacterium]